MGQALRKKKEQCDIRYTKNRRKEEKANPSRSDIRTADLHMDQDHKGGYEIEIPPPVEEMLLCEQKAENTCHKVPEFRNRKEISRPAGGNACRPDHTDKSLHRSGKQEPKQKEQNTASAENWPDPDKKIADLLP